MRSGSRGSERSAVVDALTGPSAVAWQAALVAVLVFVAGCARTPPNWGVQPWRTVAAVGEGFTAAEGPSVAAFVDALQREPAAFASAAAVAGDDDDDGTGLTHHRSGSRGGGAKTVAGGGGEDLGRRGTPDVGVNAGRQPSTAKAGTAPPRSSSSTSARKQGTASSGKRPGVGRGDKATVSEDDEAAPSKATGETSASKATGLASWWNPTQKATADADDHDGDRDASATGTDVDPDVPSSDRDGGGTRQGGNKKTKKRGGDRGKAASQTRRGPAVGNGDAARRRRSPAAHQPSPPADDASRSNGVTGSKNSVIKATSRSSKIVRGASPQQQHQQHQQNQPRNSPNQRKQRPSGQPQRSVGAAHSSSLGNDDVVAASSSSRASVAGRDRSSAGASADSRRRRRAGSTAATPSASSSSSSSSSEDPHQAGPQGEEKQQERRHRRTPSSSASSRRAEVVEIEGDGDAPLFEFWPLSQFEALVVEAFAGLDAVADMAADLTTAWLIAIGVLSLLLGCAVLYALRQVTVLREGVDQLAIDLVQSRSDLDKSVKEASKKAMEASAATAAAASPNTHAQAAEAAELLIRMRTVEKELTGQQERLTEFIHRAATERAAPSRRSDPVDADASFANMVSPSGSPAQRRRSFANGTGSPTGNESGLDAASPGHSVAADDSVALQAARMLAESAVAQRNARPVRHTNRGLSFSLPPKLWVYERMSSDPRDCVMKKRLHAIMLGHSADVNVPGEVCFLFATTETSRQQGMADLLSEAARNRTGAPGVTCIPASAILAMDIRPAPRELVDSMGPVAGDGRNLLISVYRATSGVALVDGSSSSAGPGGRKTGGWSASEPGERSGALGSTGAGDGFTRRQFLSRTSGASGGASVSDKPFVVFMPSSLALDEWVNFVVLLLGDKVKVAEGATAEAHFTDL